MKLKSLFFALACFCTTAQAQLIPTYSQQYIDSISEGLDPNAFELIETADVKEPFDKYATKVQYNGPFMLTYSTSAKTATLFKRAGSKWFFKQEVDFESLLDLDDTASTSFRSNALYLNSDGSIDISFEYYNPIQELWVTDVGRYNYDGTDFSTFASFELDLNLDFDQIAADGDKVLLRASSQLYVYQLAGAAQLLGTFNLESDVSSMRQLKILPDTNRLLVAGYTYEYRSKQTIFAEYEYSVNSQELVIEKHHSLELSPDLYSDTATIVVGENREDYVVASRSTSYAYRYHYTSDSNDYAALTPIDISTFDNYQYEAFSGPTFYLYGKLYSYNRGKVYSFDLQRATGVNLEFTLDNYYNNRPILVGMTSGTYMFTSGSAFTTVYSREDGSATPLTSGADLAYLTRVSDLDDSTFIGIGYDGLTVFGREKNSLAILFRADLESFAGNYRALELVDNTLYLFTTGLVYEVEFTKLSDGSIEYDVTSFPIIDLDNSLYNSYIYRAKFDPELGHMLITDSRGFRKVEKDGQVYKVTRGFNSNDEAFQLMSGMTFLTITDEHLFVVSSGNTLSIFDITGSEPQLLSETYDPAIFNSSQISVSVNGDKLNVKTHEYYAVFSRDEDSNLQLEVVTPFTGTWLDTGSYYSMELDRFENINLRQKHLETGAYRLLSSQDASLNSPVLLATATKAIMVGRLSGTYQSNPVAIKLFSYQRAPIALQDELAVFANQGESISVDLRDLFQEDDIGQNLDFTSDIPLFSIGLEIDGGMLKSTDSEYFNSEEFVISATDVNGKSAAIDVQTSINRRPQLIQSLPELSLRDGDQTSVDLNDYFYDDQDQTISFALQDDVEGVSLDDDGVLSVATSSAGDYEIGISVTDNLGATNQAVLYLSVTQASQPAPATETTTPVVETSSPTTTLEPSDSDSSGGSSGPGLIAMLMGLLLIRLRRT